MIDSINLSFTRDITPIEFARIINARCHLVCTEKHHDFIYGVVRTKYTLYVNKETDLVALAKALKEMES